MAFLNDKTSIRFKGEMRLAIEELIEKYPNKYFSVGHLIRCALMLLLEETRRLEENENRRLKN